MYIVNIETNTDVTCCEQGFIEITPYGAAFTAGGVSAHRSLHLQPANNVIDNIIQHRCRQRRETQPKTKQLDS